MPGEEILKGQIDFTEYLQRRRKVISSCSDCACRNCLLWWSSRCPYGGCFDDKRAVEDPYDKAHTDKQPRTAWTDWNKPGEQAHWCRGGALYPVSYCEKFIKYQGCTIKECLKSNVAVYQDGYIYCWMIENYGCEQCYKEFEERKYE